MSGAAQDLEVLITVKAYPNRSAKYVETVCVAGVTGEGRWIRLYPVQFRQMDKEAQFAKYQLVKLRAAKHPRDSRPESFRPLEETIQLGEVLTTDRDRKWDRRREWIDRTLSPSMCAIRRQQESDRTSLGAFRPKVVEDLVVSRERTEDLAQQEALFSQLQLFGEHLTPVERPDFVFRYVYRCDDPACTGHTQSIIDWEILQLFRNVRRGHDEKAALAKVKDKFLGELCSPKRDTAFFVGNHSGHPNTFMILGVFWPPKREPMLFE